MDINITLLGQMITFGIFVWFTMRFVWPPIMQALTERQKQIADGLAAGERGKHELELAQQKAATLLREAKDQATELLAQADKRAAAMRDEAKVQAREEGERLIQLAKVEITQQQQQAKEALRQEVAALALFSAEKVLGQQIDEQLHNNLVSNMLSEMSES